MSDIEVKVGGVYKLRSGNIVKIVDTFGEYFLTHRGTYYTESGKFHTLGEGFPHFNIVSDVTQFWNVERREAECGSDCHDNTCQNTHESYWEFIPLSSIPEKYM